MTPFDRDDMYRLAGALDDVCDHVDDAAEKIVGYGVREIREQAREQADVIHRAAGSSRRRSPCSRASRTRERQLIELRELEDEGDRLAARQRSRALQRGADAVELDALEGHPRELEEAVDACENAADVLEAILVKNR